MAVPTSDSGVWVTSVESALAHVHLGQTEVEDLRVAAGGHEDIGGLDIAVHDAARVRRLQAIGDLDGHAEHRVKGHRAATHGVKQRLSLEEFGDDIRHAIVPADVVHREDVRVIQCRGCARFLLESREAIRVGDERGWQHLDRDVPLQPGVSAAIHLTHAARADLGSDFIWAEASAGS